ncbi:MAG: hypothetical protein WA584_16355 [Pyrinomonadaceae bacterium]
MKINETLSKEMILLLINGIVLCVAAFFLNNYYNSLINFEDIKWEKEQIECLSDDCKETRQMINIYRFGKDVAEVKLSFKLTNPNFEIKNCSVKQYERSITSFIIPPQQRDLIGRRISLEDSELNEKNSCSYEMSTLNPTWNYMMIIDFVNKTGKGPPNEKFGIFQIEDSKFTRYNHENLDFQDYLRLYLVQFGALAIILVFILTVVIFLLGRRILGSTSEEPS